MRLRIRPRAIALVTTLLFTVILAMMVGAMLFATSGQKGLTLHYHQTVSALYVAEAGVSDAMARLTADPDWAPTNPVTITMPNGKGSYTIVFDSDGNVEPFESVNNLANGGAVDGPRGEDSVPANTVDLVVVASVNGVERELEVLLHRSAGGQAALPLIASEKIFLEGDVVVDGIKSITDPSAVTAGIHSNSSDDSSDLVKWDSSADDTASISGEVSVQSGNSSAINMDSGSGSYSSAGESISQPFQPFPSTDIPATVSANSSHPAITVVPFGTTEVSEGDFTFNGGTINGDVVLDNANLYITGDVTINGSITGSGSIYVDGNTTLDGDSSVIAKDDANVALFSRGNVTLNGFGGTQFLQDLADADPNNFGVYHDDAKIAMAKIQEAMLGGYTRATATAQQHTDLDAWRRTLAQHTGNSAPNTHNNTLEEMANYLDANYPNDDTAQFLSDKFRDQVHFLDGQAEGNNGTSPGNTPILQDYLDDGPAGYGGTFAAFVDFDFPTANERVRSQVLHFDNDKLGMSYFQGFIYTNGFLYANNEIEVIGGVYAEVNADSPTGPWNVGNHTLNPGDIYLVNGSSIIYNEELMQGSAGGSGPIAAKTWLGR